MFSSLRTKWFSSRPTFPAKRRLSGNPQSATRGMMLGLIVSVATLLLLSNHPAGQGLENDTLDFWFGLRNATSPDMQPSQHVACSKWTKQRCAAGRDAFSTRAMSGVCSTC
jgi:hypothetical protein